MKIEVGAYHFNINSDWIAEAGIKPFSEVTDHYFFKQPKNLTEHIVIVNLNDIDPNIRGKDIPIFKAGKVNGKLVPAKKRVLDILSAIEKKTALPPVEITEAIKGQYKYKLHNGCHRVHLSILAGFKTIPAIFKTGL